MSSGFKSPLQPSAASVSDTSRETESEMVSDVTHQLSTTSPTREPAAVGTKWLPWQQLLLGQAQNCVVLGHISVQIFTKFSENL